MTSEGTKYADRCYRSPAGLLGGVLLLALVLWLGVDALVRGDSRTRLTALAALLVVVPLITAFTLRPAVYAGAERLRVRNPFRTVTLPWATVDEVRARMSSEVLAGGRRFQMWAIPVSLRQRKKAARRAARAGSDERKPRGVLRTAEAAADAADGYRAPADQAIDELGELAQRHAGDPQAQGTPQVRWAYEIIVPAAAGVLALLMLFLLG